MKLTILIIAALLTAGCMTLEEQIAYYTPKCAGLGFTPGTDEFSACIQREINAAEQRDATYGAAYL